MSALFEAAPVSFPEFDRISTADLKAELSRELSLTAERLMRCAQLWVVLRGRGEDLSDLKEAFALYIPQIAAGTVLPAVVVTFSGRPGVLRKLARLAIDDQKRILNGEPVDVVTRPGEVRRFPISKLTPRLVNLVVGDGVIRDATEQMAIVSTPPLPWKPGRPIRVGKIVVDREAGTVRLGRAVAPAADVIQALRSAGMLPTG
jgi:hypothetical protein